MSGVTSQLVFRVVTVPHCLQLDFPTGRARGGGAGCCRRGQCRQIMWRRETGVVREGESLPDTAGDTGREVTAAAEPHRGSKRSRTGPGQDVEQLRKKGVRLDRVSRGRSPGTVQKLDGMIKELPGVAVAAHKPRTTRRGGVQSRRDPVGRRLLLAKGRATETDWAGAGHVRGGRAGEGAGRGERGKERSRGQRIQAPDIPGCH